jgi:hypothetical protein
LIDLEDEEEAAFDDDLVDLEDEEAAFGPSVSGSAEVTLSFDEDLADLDERDLEACVASGLEVSLGCVLTASTTAAGLAEAAIALTGGEDDLESQ